MAPEEIKHAQDERCLACGGDGYVHDPITDGLDFLCPVCHGDGYVEPDDNMTLSEFDKRHRLRFASEQD